MLQNKTTGLAHIGLPTKDYAGTLAFYEKLGFETVHQNTDPNNGNPVSFMQLGGVMFEIYPSDEAAGQVGALEHVAFEVNDLDEVYRLVTQSGIQALEGKVRTLPFWEKGVRFFTIMGPNKEKLEFSQTIKE